MDEEVDPIRDLVLDAAEGARYETSP